MYQLILSTDTISEDFLTKVNENNRKRAFLGDSAMSADFTVWADDTDGNPRDIYYVTTGASVITATLPDVTPTTSDAYKGRVVTIMKVDSGAGSVTIDGDGSQTINGSATVSLASQYNYRTLQSNGVEWFVIGSN